MHHFLIPVLLASSAPTTLLSDNFNRADSATTMGNANTGQVWTPLIGTWGIIGNQAYTTDTVTVDLASIDAGISNFIISTNIKFSSNEGIVFRLTDSANQIMLRVINSNISLIRNVAGVTTSIGSFAFTAVVGSLYNVKAICNGSSIRVFLDGIERFSAIETFNQTATKVGLRTGTSAAGRFDDFLVEAL